MQSNFATNFFKILSLVTVSEAETSLDFFESQINRKISRGSIICNRTVFVARCSVKSTVCYADGNNKVVLI